jgi:hypothetical protein
MGIVAAYNFARRFKALKGPTFLNTSAKSGLVSQIDPFSIRSSKCRD